MDFKLLLAEELICQRFDCPGQEVEEVCSDAYVSSTDDEGYPPPPPPKKKRRSVDAQPDENIRKYGAAHLLVMVEASHASQCRRDGGKGKTFRYIKCVRCNTVFSCASPRQKIASLCIIRNLFW